MFLRLTGSEASVRGISHNENVMGTVEADETRQVDLTESVIEASFPDDTLFSIDECSDLSSTASSTLWLMLL